MQAGHAFGEQPLAHARGVVHAYLPDRGPVVRHRLQPLPQLRRHPAAAELKRPLDHPQAGDGHDAGDDRHVAALRRDPVAQAQVILGVEEHLGDREIRASPALGQEVAHVRVQVGRARV